MSTIVVVYDNLVDRWGKNLGPRPIVERRKPLKEAK